MRRIADLPYRPDTGRDASARCRADLYLPAAAEADVVVWFYGGGLTEGGKGGPQPPIAVPEGFALVCPDYRLLSHAPFPACLDDAAASLAWAPGAVAAHGVRCRRLFVAGLSAGAYLAAMVALDRSWLAVYGASPDALAGAAPLSGQMACHFTYAQAHGLGAGRTMIDRFAPLYHIRGDAPPILLAVGDSDMPCRLEENMLMRTALRTAGHRHHACHVVAGRDHGQMGSGLQDPRDAVARLLLAFLRDPMSG